ncbi:DAK2 domain-containing protein [Nesterenkonia alba]|uniref:DAK2 domain-containing protein n=1 Tax=Nesterenkonia alba TaxID=515814 RepID=UPI0003B6755B|nr:DAK2 domain-containing protein [Nesterenkonia alba]
MGEHRGTQQDRAPALRRWFALAEETLSEHRQRLNRINVFPIADSDTGTNMLTTVRACRAAIQEHPTEDLGELLGRAGSAAMSTAQGNSGTLLAVMICGLAEPLRGSTRLSLTGLSRALDRGSLRTWAALSDPVDGTMLSVLDAARDRAKELSLSAENPEAPQALYEAMVPMLQAAHTALSRTEHQLPPLTEAEVVDAGGLGLLMVLAALAEAITGTRSDPALWEDLSGWQAPATERSPHHRDSAQHGEPGGEIQGVELMCTAALDPLGAASVRQRLTELGEAVIITPIDTDSDERGTYRWRIHVHTDDVVGALSAVGAAGEILESSSTPLR